MNLADNLDRTARARGRAAAVVHGDLTLSFAELDGRSRVVAALLADRGVRPGDRVALALPDLPAYAVVYYAILRLGAVVVPIGSGLDEQAVGRRLRGCGVTTVVADTAARGRIAPAAHHLAATVWWVSARDLDGSGGSPGPVRPLHVVEPRDPDDTAVIAFTAGATGEPRGAELTHANLTRNCEAVVNDLVQLTSDDVVLSGLPLVHLLAQTAALNAAMRAGACLVLLDRRHGETEAEAVLRTVVEHDVTVLVAGPDLLGALVRHPRSEEHGRSRLRVCVAGGAAVPVEVLLAFEEVFGCLVLEGYGLAETSPVVASNRIGRRRVGSVGVPVDGVEVRVVDRVGTEVPDDHPGEVVVRGHNVMKRYHGQEAATATALAGGWLHTGDVGVRDDDGFFYVLDRLVDRAADRPLTPSPRLETRA